MRPESKLPEMMRAGERLAGVHRRLPTLLFRAGLGPVGRRWLTTEQREARYALLREIYSPFHKLVEGSAEYDTLARSGWVWQGRYRPDDTEPYKAVQKKHTNTLEEIDKFAVMLKPRLPDLAKSLLAEHAHQSIQIEHNPLKLSFATSLYNHLKSRIFEPTSLSSMPAQDLARLSLPNIGIGPDNSHIMELKNHIIASQWIAETATVRQGTSGLDEEETRHLAALTIRGTASERLSNLSWGGRVPPGGYRKLPVMVYNNPLRIFPYPQEVPACMKRLFVWRDNQHRNRATHPLIHACHIMAYFVHIHPFPDGNGRVSRMLMHDYMARQGYLPVVFKNFRRDDFMRWVEDAHNGKPEDMVVAVLEAELDKLKTFCK